MGRSTRVREVTKDDSEVNLGAPKIGCSGPTKANLLLIDTWSAVCDESIAGTRHGLVGRFPLLQQGSVRLWR